MLILARAYTINSWVEYSCLVPLTNFTQAVLDPAVRVLCGCVMLGTPLNVSSTRAQPTIHYIVPYMVPVCSLLVTVCSVLEVKCVDYALLSNISLRCAINYCAALIAVLVVLRQVQNVTDSVGDFCSERIKVPYSYYCLLCSFAYCAVLHYNTTSI